MTRCSDENLEEHLDRCFTTAPLLPHPPIYSLVGIVKNRQTRAEVSTTAPVPATAVKEAVLGHQNGRKTRPNGSSPPIVSLESFINQEILQGDD